MIWIACMLAGQVCAQSVFNKLESIGFGFSKIDSSGDNYYAICHGFNASGSGTLIPALFDSLGNAILVDTFSTDGIASYSGSFAIADDRIFLFSTFNATPPFNYATADVQLSLCDMNFTVQDSVIFGGSDTEVSRELRIIENELYLLGSTKSYGVGSYDIYFSKYDTLGNLIWSQTYGGSNDDASSSFTETMDGKILILGVKRIAPSNWNLFLVKVDPANGQVIWGKNYGGPYIDFAGEITALHDHGFLVYHNVDNGSTDVGYIDKLDGNGDLVWSKAFPYNNLSSFSYSHPIENMDGSIVVNGGVKNSNGSIISRILKLTPMGDTMWTREYFTNPNMPQYIYDIKATDEGGYILCGSARDSNFVQRAWLIKTNCLGEDGTQYPVSGAPCDYYDCTLYPIDASFTPSTTYIDLGIESGLVTFENNSSNTTSRVWHFGDGVTDYTDSIISHTYTQPGIYEVELIVFHGMCSDTLTQTIEVVNTAGNLSANLDYGVSVFPNPSNGSFVISFKHTPEGYFEIVDLAGRVHRMEKLNGALSYPIDGLNPGVYLIQVYYPSGLSEMRRVIVE